MTRLRNKSKTSDEAIAVQIVKQVPASSFSHSLLARLQALLVCLDQPGRWLTVLICCALFLVALGFNLYQIGAPSIWFDEALSVTRAQQSLPILWRIVSFTQPNMALYYVVLHFWLSFMNLSGLRATEAVVRFPSAVFSALSSLVMYFLARRFFGSLLALFAATIYLLNTLRLTYAQEARAYTLQLLFLCLSWYALCVLFSSDLSRKQARLWWTCFVLSSVLAMYAQLFTELVLAAQALAMVMLFLVPNAWRTRVRRQVRPLLVSWLCIGVLIAPILYASRVGSKTGWLPIPRPRELYNLFLVITAQSRFLLALCALAILVGLLVALLAAPLRGQNLLKQISLLPADEAAEKQWQRHFFQLLPLAIFLLCWLLCPIAVSYIISQKSTHLFSSRYLVVVVPPFLLLVALGMSALRWRIVQLLFGLCLLSLCLRHVPGYYQNAQVEDWRTGTRWLQQHYRPGDGLVCYDNAQGCAVDIEYYLQAYGTKHPRLFFGLGRADTSNPQLSVALHWLNTHYLLIGKESTSTLTFYLYDTTAR